MAEETQFEVVQLTELAWPESMRLPGKRFRLLVAADTTCVPASKISDFAAAALSHGMVYFCAWGPGCERFHDIVDEVCGPLPDPTPKDVVMTTWHSSETLEEALDFLATCAVPTDGYAQDSDYRVVVCVGNNDWGERATRFLKDAEFCI